MTSTIILFIALTSSPPANISDIKVITAPQLLGGSVIRVQSGGRLTVADQQGRPRWSVQIGTRINHVAANNSQVFVASGNFIRAFKEGASRWSMDVGSAVEALRMVADRLEVQLSAGMLYVDPQRGRFCTPRDPCDGMPTWTAGTIGVPFLDLPGLGYPGLGLLINPRLIAQGDRMQGAISPGRLPGWGLAPSAPPAPQVESQLCTDEDNCGGGMPMRRNLSAGEHRIKMRKDVHGKTRGIRIDVGFSHP